MSAGTYVVVLESGSYKVVGPVRQIAELFGELRGKGRILECNICPILQPSLSKYNVILSTRFNYED